VVQPLSGCKKARPHREDPHLLSPDRRTRAARALSVALSEER
jgi:hypothetical protein